MLHECDNASCPCSHCIPVNICADGPRIMKVPYRKPEVGLQHSWTLVTANRLFTHAHHVSQCIYQLHLFGEVEHPERVGMLGALFLSSQHASVLSTWAAAQMRRCLLELTSRSYALPDQVKRFAASAGETCHATTLPCYVDNPKQ